MKGPRILIIDIETSPLEVYSWGIHDQNIGVNQIKTDWQIISFAAKWLDKNLVIQSDQSKTTEESLIYIMHVMLNSADIIVTQNGKKFDIPKIKAKCIEYGLPPIKTFQQIDILEEAKRQFAFTSNSLEYVSKKFNKKYKKLDHKEFPGQELWTECLKGNKKAWRCMAKYNKWDVLATEERFLGMRPWIRSINWNVYYGDVGAVCSCGSKDFHRNGFAYSAAGKFQRYECRKCGAELKTKNNLHKGSFRKV